MADQAKVYLNDGQRQFAERVRSQGGSIAFIEWGPGQTEPVEVIERLSTGHGPAIVGKNVIGAKYTLYRNNVVGADSDVLAFLAGEQQPAPEGS